MAVLVLIVIYIAFIGLGIPDSLIGSAWPAVFREFDLPVESLSCVTLLISGCTVLSGIFSDRLLNRFGTEKVTAVSTALTAFALLGFSLSHHFLFLCLLAIPLGLGAGAIDAGLNNYIALHYSARHMNYLHCFYGVGVACSPYLMSRALAEHGWREGYRSAFLVQLAITLIIVLSLPLWKKVQENSTQEQLPQRTLGFRALLAMPEVRTVWVVMLATNAIEYACGAWGSTFLVQARGLAPDRAALMLTLYYTGMALGRFLSGVISGKIPTWRRIALGCLILAFAVLLLLAPLPVIWSAAGLFLVGLGNGSVYPNFIHLTPANFGADISQSVMGSQIAAAYTGVMLTPPLFGFVAQFLGMRALPGFLAVLYVILIASILLFIRRIRVSGRFDPRA